MEIMAEDSIKNKKSKNLKKTSENNKYSNLIIE